MGSPPVILLAATLLAASPAVPSPLRAREAAVAAALASAPPGGPRVDAATRPLLGLPYVSSPLGEGSGPDPDPRFRLDAFDCMTFVETGLALGSAASLEEARAALDELRYDDGPPALEARLHEVLSQWLPRNVARGWLAPAALPPGAPAARRLAKTYDAAAWAAIHRAGRAIPGLPPAREPSGTFEVDAVPPDDAAAAAALLPAGTVVIVVRADGPGRATRVSHMGLLVKGAGGASRVRHATSSVGVARVIEEPFVAFVARERAAWPPWPLEGLAFFTALDATRREAALGHRPAVPATALPAPGRP